MCTITSFSARPRTCSFWHGLRCGYAEWWKEVGFERPRSWGRAFGVGIAVGLAMEVLELFVTQPLLIGICRLEKAEGGYP